MFLLIEGLSKSFGGLAAVSDVDFRIEEKEIVGLIGPNGAGKTTFFNLLTGVHKPTAGKILFEGRDITGLKPHQIANLGILRTFQLTRTFNRVSVLEHVIMGQHCQQGTWAESLINRSQAKRKKEEMRKKAVELLDFTKLFSVKDEYAENISSAQQRCLMIATALAAGPKIILLDEPTAGMSAEETAQVVEMIKEIRDRGIAVFIIEHNMKVTMNICNRVIVLNYGKKIADGRPEEIAKNQAVIDAYLGEE